MNREYRKNRKYSYVNNLTFWLNNIFITYYTPIWHNTFYDIIVVWLLILHLNWDCFIQLFYSQLGVHHSLYRLNCGCWLRARCLITHFSKDLLQSLFSGSLFLPLKCLIEALFLECFYFFFLLDLFPPFISSFTILLGWTVTTLVSLLCGGLLLRNI